MSRGTSDLLSTSSNMTAAVIFLWCLALMVFPLIRLHVDYLVALFGRVVILLIVVLDVDNSSK